MAIASVVTKNLGKYVTIHDSLLTCKILEYVPNNNSTIECMFSTMATPNIKTKRTTKNRETEPVRARCGGVTSARLRPSLVARRGRQTN